MILWIIFILYSGISSNINTPGVHYATIDRQGVSGMLRAVWEVSENALYKVAKMVLTIINLVIAAIIDISIVHRR